MTKAEKKRLCAGCRNNRYNQGKGFVERPGIDAVVTCDECWSFRSAVVVKKKIVSLSQTPPWDQDAVSVLSCYSRTGYALIDPHRTS